MNLYAANAQTLHLRSTAARLELKEINGTLHKRWNMWFNLTIRVKPYQILDINKIEKKSFRLFFTDKKFTREHFLFCCSYFIYRCCMVVVSSRREMFG